MEYVARATALQRKKQVGNIRIKLENSEDKEGGVISGGSNATTNHFNYILGQSNWKLNLLGCNRTNLYIVDRKVARIYLGISPQSKANCFIK